MQKIQNFLILSLDKQKILKFESYLTRNYWFQALLFTKRIIKE